MNLLPCDTGHDELKRVIDDTVAAGPGSDDTNRYATPALQTPAVKMCGCGKPVSHRGRCSFRRAEIAAGRYVSVNMKKRLERDNAARRPVAKTTRRDEFADEVVGLRKQLYGYAKSLTQSAADADDLVSKAVLQMLEKRDQFQPGTNLMAWATTITRNLFISDKRRERNNVSLMVEGPDGTYVERVEPQLTTPLQQESGLHAREMVRKVLSLPPHQRSTVLRATEGVPYEQIAANDGVSVGTVKSRVSRARSILNDDDRVTSPPKRDAIEAMSRGEQRPINKIGFSTRVLRRPPLMEGVLKPTTNDPIDAAIAKLEADRAKIDAAIAALKVVKSIHKAP